MQRRRHVTTYCFILYFWNLPLFRMIINRQWISKRAMLGKSESSGEPLKWKRIRLYFGKHSPPQLKDTEAQKLPRWAASACLEYTALGTLWFVGCDGHTVWHPAAPQEIHSIRSTDMGFSNTRRVEWLEGFKVSCNTHFIPCRRMIFGSKVKSEATVFVKSYLPGFQENCSIFLRHTISKST